MHYVSSTPSHTCMISRPEAILPSCLSHLASQFVVFIGYSGHRIGNYCFSPRKNLYNNLYLVSFQDSLDLRLKQDKRAFD